MHQQINQPELEKSAFELLYRRHMPAILAYVTRRVSSREDAEDLLIEVFLAALEKYASLKAFDDEMQLAWLRRVAHNKLIDFYRRTSRRPAITLEEHVDMLYDDDEREPEQVALRQEKYAWLHANLEQLPESQQEVLRLHFAAGLRCVEIARLLNKSDGAIRMLLARALNSLRSIYEQQQEGWQE